MSRLLNIAAAQFPVSGVIERNARHICRQISEAADRGATIVQFPEAALSGYAPAHLFSLEDYEWDVLAESTERICRLASSLRIWVVMGSMRRVDGERPRLCLLVISDRGEVTGTYDKRRL